MAGNNDAQILDIRLDLAKRDSKITQKSFDSRPPPQNTDR
jgi:hypothetical protein